MNERVKSNLGQEQIQGVGGGGVNPSPKIFLALLFFSFFFF